MFATAILKLRNLPPGPRDERVYDLNPLRQRGFQFVYAVGSGISGVVVVVVKKLRLSSRVKKGDRITVEADTAEDPDTFDGIRPPIKADTDKLYLCLTVPRFSAGLWRS